MSSSSLLQRLGFGHPPELRLAWAVVALGLALYALGYAAFYPSGPTVDDEDLYLEQTMLWLDSGSFQTSKLDPLTEQLEPFVPGDYPVGTIALMAPFAAAFGRNAAFLSSFVCFGSVGEPMSIIEGVRSVPPGHSLLIHTNSPAADVEPKSYWNLETIERSKPVAAAAKDQIAKSTR